MIQENTAIARSPGALIESDHCALLIRDFLPTRDIESCLYQDSNLPSARFLIPFRVHCTRFAHVPVAGWDPARRLRQTCANASSGESWEET
jgi:hypothetical protein